MARKRMLQPTMWDDPDLAAVTPTERLLFIGLISLADDYGHVTANPLQLRKAIFGYDDFTLDDVRDMRDHLLAACHNLELYVVEGQEYIWLKQWERHQDLRYRAAAQHPCHACGRYHEAKDWDDCKDLPVACDDVRNDDANTTQDMCKDLRSTTQELRKDCARTTQGLRKPLRPNYVTLNNDTLDNVTNIIVADSIADEAQAESEPQLSEGSEPHRLANLLKSLILSNNPTARLRTQTPKQFDGWCAEIDRMLRLDQRTPGNIEGVIRWSQADDFWKQNILSPSKLREKYDQLWLRFTSNPRLIPRAASPPPDTSPIVEDAAGRAFIEEQRREQEEWDAKHRKRTTTTADTTDRRDGDGIVSIMPAVQGRGLDGAEADERGRAGRHQSAGLGDADEVRVQPLARGTNGQDGHPPGIHRLAPRG